MTSWIDDFLFWDFTTVAILGFTDWAIGNEGRKKMKEGLANFWIVIDDLSYKRLAVEKAVGFNNKLIAIFGESIFSWERILFSFIPSLFMGFIMLWAVLSSDTSRFEWDFIYGTLIYFSINVLYDWVCLTGNIYLIRHIAVKKSSFSIVLSILGLAVLIVSFLPIVLFLGWMFAALISSVLHISNYIFVIWIVYIKVVPLGFYFLYLTFLFFIKAFRFILQKPINTMLLRLYETKQGILTQFALAGGVIAKLLQEYIKYIA